MKVTAISYLIFILIFKRCYSTSHLLVTRAGPCNGGTETSVKVSEMIVDNSMHEVYVTGQMNISEDLNNGWSIKATMLKCHDIRNLDTCDFYKSTSIVKDGCIFENEEDASILEYALLFSYIQPRLSCPLKAGTYEVTDFPLLNVENEAIVVESKISTSVFGYTYRFEGFDDELDKVMCIDAYLQLKYDRDHNWFGESDSKPEINDPSSGRGDEDKHDSVDEE